MCGIAGILLFPNSSDRKTLSAIKPMTETLRHRGPDGTDVWIDEHVGIAFGHRRLAINDLSQAGHQPMRSASGRFVITFNGEIYNFRDLRRELEGMGCRLRGGSDTEVMLVAIETWGIEAALGRSIGMFALGLWDTEMRILHLARDRVGKKPLYVAVTDKALLFASELKAINAFSGFRHKLNTIAAAAMLANGWVPDHLCIWHDAFKLSPGGILSITAADLACAPSVASLQAQTKPWWSLAEIAINGRKNLNARSDAELTGKLDDLLRLSVRDRMIADVSLGAFLSGGIDSATVVALMQAQSTRPVRTFTIAFGETAFDESAHAAEVARHLGTDHTELRLTPSAARDVIPELPHIWDEPFADESQIPTLLVSRLARKHVTVALTGDGGDECFGGYARHYTVGRLAKLYHMHPLMRSIPASMLAALAGDKSRAVLDRLPLGDQMHHALRSDRLRRLAHLLEAADERDMLHRLSTRSAATFGGQNLDSPSTTPQFSDVVSRLIFEDMARYLPGDVLVKLDRATMANSLEGRCPLLDHRVIEFAWQLPTNMKVRLGRGKWILRQVLRRYVPDRLIDRPKQGFDVPIGTWLRGPLHGWASDLLASLRRSDDRLVDMTKVDASWRDHLAGRQDHSRDLWSVLMFQAWQNQARQADVSHDTPSRQSVMTGA